MQLSGFLKSALVPRGRPRFRAPTVALGLALLAAPASAQYPASDTNALFDPSNRVPLSEFVDANLNEQVTFTVRNEILAHPGRIRVAQFDGNTVEFKVPFAIVQGGPVNGQVVHNMTKDAFAVVVNLSIQNRFNKAGGPANIGIPTHWKYDATGGTFQLGWGDGIQTRDYQGVITDFLTPQPPPAPDHGIFGGTGNLSYNEQWRLFVDKSGAHANETVPAFERYVAEDWTGVAVTKLAAIRVSDYSREKTGIPVAHRTWWQEGVPLESLVDEGLPLIQVLHNYIVQYEDPATVGSENCLATFFLPPDWEQLTGEQAYKVMFTSTYDAANTNIGGAAGLHLEAIGQVYADDAQHKAIGVITNGGGFLTVGLNASAPQQLLKLWEDAADAFSMSRTEIVNLGASRSATTGLALWSHPDLTGPTPNESLAAALVVAGGPNTDAQEAFYLFGNPTHRLVQFGLQQLTGLVDSFFQDIPPVPPPTPVAVGGSGVGAVQALANLADAFGAQPLGSSARTTALLARGTMIFLGTGTHDESYSFEHHIEYANALLAAGVPLRWEVNYRAGHDTIHNLGDPYGSESTAALKYLFLGMPATGVHYYRFASAADEAAGLRTEFFPQRAPVHLEFAHEADSGSNFTFTVVGPPGTLWALYFHNYDCTGNVPTSIVPFGGVPSGILSGAASDPFGFDTRLGLAPTTSVTMCKGYELHYLVPGSSTVGVLPVANDPEGATPAPAPFLQDGWPYVKYRVNGTQTVGISTQGRTGGLSEDLTVPLQ